MSKACVICGKPIIRKGQITCSARCRKQASRSRIKLEAPTETKHTIENLQLERVNEIVWKIVEGNKAVAWIHNVGWINNNQHWTVRIKNEKGNFAYGPTTFHRAREAAFLILAGGFHDTIRVVKDDLQELHRYTVIAPALAHYKPKRTVKRKAA